MTDGELHELRETIIRGGHTALSHASGELTYYYLKDYFYWPSMRKNTMDCCKQCNTCQRKTLSTQAPQGLAGPIPIPDQPFTHIAMNFLSLCKWGSGLLKSRLCFLTSKNHKQDYKQRGTTTWG